ncbi:GroES-like protein [Atractiella rhizophila]|nr:GroES-like protein [Atractiella rhizophila]
MAQNIPKTQKVAIFHELNGPIKIEDAPVIQPDQLKAGEALVNVKFSGVCHTDLHANKGDWPIKPKVPLIGGHEGAGIIVAIGKGTETDLKVGDPVGIKWLADSCLKCSFCRQGHEPNCQSAKLSGYTQDGSFQQYAVSFTRHLSKIPEGLSLADAAPILCAGVTVYRALLNSGLKAGEWIALPGAGGGLGHLAVQYARNCGLRIIAVDTGADKKKLCMDLGADKWVDFRESKDIVKDMKAATPDGLGPHAAIITSSVGAAYEQAMEYIRPTGTVVAVGLPPAAKVSADVFFTVFDSKKLVGSYVGNRQDAEEALDLAAAGRVKCLYKVLPLSELPNVYKDMHDGKVAGRIVLDLSK